MIKYLVGLGGLAVLVVGYFLLDFTASPPTQPSAPVAVSPAPAPAPAAPEATAAQDVAPGPADEAALLEDMAADVRESLPSAVTDTLTLTDTLFLPRMRIMEHSYVTTAADPRTDARDMQTLIEARTEAICLEGRAMFGMGVTLRSSIEDRDGNLFQRIYLLPEDCQRFY